MPSPPTVTYAWMTIDEVSGHSWVTKEFSHVLANLEREKLEDDRNKAAFWAFVKEQIALAKEKSTKRHSMVLMKYKFPHYFVAQILARTQLYRRDKNERQAT